MDCAMSIQPFPAQDLAKLVLGYLVEEQLMTAYDEFLQASPYLDVFTNEYDRLCMISLKNILAEYRAMRLYVESCKPNALRKILLQHVNLLEMLKYLIRNVDLNKICHQESQTDISCAKVPKTNISNRRISRPRVSNIDSSPQAEEPEIEATGARGYLDTTPLADLPGNIQTGGAENSLRNANSNVPENPFPFSNNSMPSMYNNYNYNAMVETKNIADMNLKRVSSVSSYQDFGIGMEGYANPRGMSASQIVGAPTIYTQANKLDQHATGMTSNSVSITIPTRIETSHIANNLLPHQVATETSQKRNDSLHSTDSNLSEQSNKTKIDENKIKILSDVKVEHTLLGKEETKTISNINGNKIPPLLDNASPQLHLKTIYVNGTPAYKNDSQFIRKYTFTKDEIMAMPTIILVPTAAPPHIPINTVKTVQAHSPIPLSKPLTIEVKNTVNQNVKTVIKDVPNILNEPVTLAKESTQDFLLKTAVPSNASLPKDVHSTIQSTPQINLPVRKASSTPRRTSHVRVLDFSTPLHINEEAISENLTPTHIPEAIISKSSNLLEIDDSNIKDVEKQEVVAIEIENDKVSSAKKSRNINLPPTKIINNWDAELRALIANEPKIYDKPKQKPTKKKKKPPETEVVVKDNTNKKEKIANKTPRVYKKKVKIVDSETVPISVKPTINIVTEWKKNTSQEIADKSSEKQTPDMDRELLQHAMGAKLNISDLFETPFKQAILDIQMDTPRLLGPDLLDEPGSDIKIMNIPTPKFFNTSGLGLTPNLPQATPSSYSSRPTDYSSGGSYYKPDEYEYDPLHEDLELPKISNESIKDSSNSNIVENPESNVESQSNSKAKRSLRPVRKCAKNVSYFNSPANKTQECKENINNSSESINKCDSEHKKSELKSCKENRFVKDKVESKRKSKTKKSSPIKKLTPNTNIKLKMKKPSPKKSRRKSESTALKSHNQKKASCKDISTSTPIVVPGTHKSRRKSSTPRKLHCTKEFNSTLQHNIPKETKNKDLETIINADSDVENPRLRWSDEGSQDCHYRHKSENTSEVEDISKIKEYIKENFPNQDIVGENLHSNNNESLHKDLIKRGFDIDTAKSIERDLLDHASTLITSMNNSSSNIIVSDDNATVLDKEEENIAELNENSENEEELDFSVYDCDDSSKNVIEIQHIECEDLNQNITTLKDQFCMEICIEDITIRLKATPFQMLFTEECHECEENKQHDIVNVLKDKTLDKYNIETEAAVHSISNIEKLYTPKKEISAEKAEFMDIFNSSLTSLDTPLKTCSTTHKEVGVNEVVLEIEPIDDSKDTKTQVISKKRKRIISDSNSDESLGDGKKQRPQYLSNIQNFDIESVLSKLHGP